MQVRRIPLGRLTRREVVVGLPALVLIGVGTALVAGAGSHPSPDDVTQGTVRVPHGIVAPVDTATSATPTKLSGARGAARR